MHLAQARKTNQKGRSDTPSSQHCQLLLHSGPASHHCKQDSVSPALLPAWADPRIISCQDVSVYTERSLQAACLVGEGHPHAEQLVAPSRMLLTSSQVTGISCPAKNCGPALLSNADHAADDLCVPSIIVSALYGRRCHTC